MNPVMNLIFVVPSIMLYSSEISPTRCNNCVFILTQWLYSTCFGRQSHPSSRVHMLYMATGKPAHLGCKFLSDVSVVNSPIVVELLVITVLFCVVLPAVPPLLTTLTAWHIASLLQFFRFVLGDI